MQDMSQIVGTVAGAMVQSEMPTPPPPTLLASPDDGLAHCETCNDLRYLRDDVPIISPNFGQLTLCPHCGEQVERARRAAIYERKRARIDRYAVARSDRQTFATFDLRQDEENTAPVRLALQASQAFAHFPTGWLILTGSNGTGKSHLAHAIAHELEIAPIEQRPLVLFITAPDLLDLLRSGYARHDYHDLLDLARSVDLLILDDLGAERETDWAFEKLFQILNHRYHRHLPMVVVTNCRLDELEARLYDRLSDEDYCNVVTVLAPTYRQRRQAPGKVVQ